MIPDLRTYVFLYSKFLITPSPSPKRVLFLKNLKQRYISPFLYFLPRNLTKSLSTPTLRELPLQISQRGTQGTCLQSVSCWPLPMASGMTAVGWTELCRATPGNCCQVEGRRICWVPPGQACCKETHTKKIPTWLILGFFFCFLDERKIHIVKEVACRLLTCRDQKRKVRGAQGYKSYE